ncbi:hypothetical protein ACIRPH_13350 [Nocardiopsis sp. NPDC101807]|uniref:TPR repeat region-containing protein n=1 Tax=Nocardiopsis sp. NPDC101807 TaxID=3364339 RepID=UPI00381F96D1
MSALSYTECEIDRGVVASARSTFEELHATISGRSGEYNTITQPVGFEFTDLVGEGLRSAAEENHSSWSSSMMACIHAYGVLDKISTDVQWYEDKIEEIKGNLSTALANNAEPDNLNIVQQIVDSHNLDAERAWRDLETRCDETEETLRGGPTPENIRALAEGGHLGEYGLIGFYTTNDLNYFYVDESQAETIAIHIRDAVLHGHDGSIEALEDHPEFLALIGNVVARAQTAQQNGDQLLDGEIEFLETLFGDLGAVDGDDPGFLAFMDQVNSSEHISDSLRGDISRNLANSMLVLSDENIGGGMDRLPQDVVDVLDVPDFPDVNTLSHDSELPGFMDAYSDWGQPFTTLSDFLDSAGPGIQGGTEFSTTLMGTVAATLDVPYFAAGEPGDEHFQNVIDVASRNDEANYIILTGEDFEGNEFQHHESHGDLTPEKILETFYTHNWPDDGAAVSGITDWIGQSRGVDVGGVTDEIRGTALASLMATMEAPAFQEAVFATGHNLEESVGEGDSEEEVLWMDVSAGYLNGELADGFGDIFISYMDEFSDSDGLPGNKEVSHGWNDELERVELSAESRLAFTQFIMGDPDAAARVYGEVSMHTAERMEDYANSSGERDHTPTVLAGSLQGLVDNALMNESAIRSDVHNDAAAYHNKVTGAAVDVIGGLAGDGNVSGFVVEMAKFAAKESLSIPENPEGTRVPVIEDWAHDEKLMGFAISAAANADPDLMDELAEAGAVREDDGGNRYVPLDHAQWEGKNTDGTFQTVFDSLDERPWLDGEGSMANAVHNYLSAFDRTGDKWETVSVWRPEN